jgi:hypothetical protein
MPYTKTVWETGDLITAEGLNNMEDGVDDAVETSEAALSKINNMTLTINDNMELVVTI